MNSWLGLIVLVPVGLSVNLAKAEADVFRAVIQARSMSQLTTTVEKSNQLRRARAVCEAQLRTKRVPISCFQVLELEESTQKSDRNRELAWLEALCLERVKNARDQIELKRVASLSYVPKACREAAKNEADDLAYADGSAHFAEIFLRRRKIQ